MTHVTCRLTAKNRDQLRNPTPGNRLWATFLDIRGWSGRRRDARATGTRPASAGRAGHRLAGWQSIRGGPARTPHRPRLRQAAPLSAQHHQLQRHARRHRSRPSTRVSSLLFCSLKKRKGSPYSITERRVPELIPVLGSQPAGDVSHKSDGRLPLLSARPAVTPRNP